MCECMLCFYREIHRFLQTLKKGYEPLSHSKLAFPCGSEPWVVNLQVLSNFIELVLVQQGLLPVQDHLHREQIVAFTSMSCSLSKGEAPHRHTVMTTNTSYVLGQCSGSIRSDLCDRMVVSCCSWFSGWEALSTLPIALPPGSGQPQSASPPSCVHVTPTPSVHKPSQVGLL